jgi:hypothetical protein
MASQATPMSVLPCLGACLPWIVAHHLVGVAHMVALPPRRLTTPYATPPTETQASRWRQQGCAGHGHFRGCLCLPRRCCGLRRPGTLHSQHLLAALRGWHPGWLKPDPHPGWPDPDPQPHLQQRTLCGGKAVTQGGALVLMPVLLPHPSSAQWSRSSSRRGEGSHGRTRRAARQGAAWGC